MENEFVKFEQHKTQDNTKEKGVKSGPVEVIEEVAKKTGEFYVSKLAPAKTNEITAPIIKDPRVKEIEDILSAGLGEYYTTLNPVEQKKFKESGEETAKEVHSLLQMTIVKIEEIIGVIKKWLQTVPGLNKFFVEQSAKIKADKIYISRRK